jgi:lipoprotein signal peptidase
LFGYEGTFRDNVNFTTTTNHGSGWSAGFNAGVFFALGRVMSLGGLMSFTARNTTESCLDDQFGVNQCTSGDYSSENVLSFTGALLF